MGAPETILKVHTLFLDTAQHIRVFVDHTFNCNGFVVGRRGGEKDNPGGTQQLYNKRKFLLPLKK
jgi:hypothetical protein